MLLLLQLAVVFGVNAETWTENGFIRISDKIPVRLNGQPHYFIQDKTHPEPDFRKFIPFENKNDEAAIKNAIALSSLWFRVSLFNDSPDSLKVALRLYTQCKSLTVFYKNGTAWKAQHAGSTILIRKKLFRAHFMNHCANTRY